MVIIQNPSEYKLSRFEVSNTKNKKYDAILKHKTTGKEKRIPFGDKRYEHYKDSTPLKIYKKLDHGDKIRREQYRARHKGEENNKFSSGWFSWYYLW